MPCMYSREHCYVIVPCSFPGALAIGTTVQSFYTVSLFPWTQSDVPWLPCTLYKSSGGVLMDGLYSQGLQMPYEADPEKPQPGTL